MTELTWQSLQQSADWARKAANHEKAVDLYIQALAQPDVPWKAHVDMTMVCAYSHRMLGEFTEADACLTDLAEKAAQRGDDAVMVTAYAELLVVLRKSGDFMRGVQLGQTALNAAERTGQAGLKAEALLSLGLIQAQLGEFQKAQACLTEANPLIQPEDKQSILKALFLKSILLDSTGQYHDLVQTIEQALEFARSIGDRDWEGIALNGLAASQTDMTIKRSFFEQALEAFEAVGDRPYQAVVISNSSDIWAEVGLYKHAFELAQRALDMSRETAQESLFVYCFANLGGAAEGMGDLQAAIHYFTEGIIIAHKIGLIQMEHILYTYLGNSHMLLGQMEQGKEALKIADLIQGQQNPALKTNLLAIQAGVQTLSGDYPTARKNARQALRILDEIIDTGTQDISVPYICWWCYRAFLSTGKIGNSGRTLSQQAWHALELGLKGLLIPIEILSDAGLRRGYLHRNIYRRLLILEWLKQAPVHAVGTGKMADFAAQVQKPGRLDEVFHRLLKVGVRLNAQRDPTRLPDEIVQVIEELSGAERIALVLLDEQGKRRLVRTLLPRTPYPVISGKVETPPDSEVFLAEIDPWLEEAIATRQGFIRQMNPASVLTEQRSVLVVPLISQGRLVGVLYCDLRGCFGRFDPEDLNLLGVLSNQSAVAVENADWSATLEQKVTNRTEELEQSNDQLEQRNAELAIINSVQAALAAELNIQGIYDAVGDKIREIFHSDNLAIRIYDSRTNLFISPYIYENGVRIMLEPEEITEENKDIGFTGHVMRTRETLVINENIDQAIEAYHSYIYPGTQAGKSVVYVPLVVGDEARGLVSLTDMEHEHAFSESDVRLLETLVNSMSVALENARLFNETQRLLKETEQRNAELAIINSIQQGLAAELDFQAIIDLVGDKLREILHIGNLGIRWYDEKANLLHYIYTYEHGKRLSIEPLTPTPGGIFEQVFTSRFPLIGNTAAAINEYAETIPGTDPCKSNITVPVISSDKVLGIITCENYEREYAYGEAEQRLLNTIAASLGTALENARLFDETQRLFKAEQERVTELQIINSIQQGLAAEMDFQAIIDLVGEKLREVFKTPDLYIGWYDDKAELMHYIYTYEHGQRLTIQPIKPSPAFIRMIQTHQEVVWNTGEEMDILTGGVLPGTDRSISGVMIPIISSGRVLGLIQLDNYEREHAYGEAELRLLSTIAASLGTALENARLFDETQRLFKAEKDRVTELQIINSVQQGLAAELDFQAIVDLVGDKLRDVFQTPDLGIKWYDEKTNLFHYLYTFEHGKRLTIPPMPPIAGGPFLILSQSHQPVVWNTMEEGHAISPVIPGTDASMSGVKIPIISSDRFLGVVSIENFEREAAFGESELRLLTTVAASLGTALENAHLFDETQRLLKETEQRNAELAIINSVQAALAAELNIQGIYDVVGDKIREIFHNDSISIRIYDPKTTLLHYPYLYEDGKRISLESQPFTLIGFTGHVLRTRETLVINENMAQATEKYGSFVYPGTQYDKSAVYVPLIAGNQARGLVSMSNFEREHAFSDSDVRLLQTLVNSMSVALENARLFDETQRLLKETEQRNRELAIISRIGQALAGLLDPQGIYELVGEELRLVFDAQVVAIITYDRQENLVYWRYLIEKGERQSIAPHSPLGFSGHILHTREPLLITHDVAQRAIEYGSTVAAGELPKSYLGVPLIAGGEVTGVITLQNIDREEAFNEDDLRLLSTLALSMGVALENARLFETAQESQRRMADIIDFLPDATLVIDRQGKVIAWNHAIEEMTGVKAADILGKGDYEYALPFYGERRPILIDMVLIPDKEIETGYTYIQRNENILVGEATSTLKGKTAYLNATASALRNSNGEAVGAIESIRDITDQKRAEQELHQAKAEAEAANQAKSAFLAMMSHEIRTPMNAIIGMSGLLMDTSLNPDQREFAETIRSSGDSLLTIINDILDFSKIEAGKMSLEEAPFDLRECIEASLDLIKVRASEKNLELAYQMDPEVPPALLGDVTRLRQVLINLLGNSVKFTEHGEIVLIVSKGEKEGSFHFSVRDTGIGISPDRVSQLFRSFTQADASTSRRYGGTGLGLALSSRLVELMGGKMWVESEGVPEKGSTFHFIILAKPAVDWKTSPHMLGEHPQLRGRRVLVVDDNDTNRRILELQTKTWGMLPYGYPTASEALEILQHGDPFDLAILDMHMPEMGGVELASEIRKLEANRPGIAQLPLVLSTSLGGREEARESTEFDAILLKPIRQSALFDVLMTIFAGHAKPVTKSALERVILDPEMASRHPLHILLAEDNVVNQKLALRLLSQMGYRADVAANGLEVLQAIKRQPYDVILMDVQMPEMDGLEATRRLCADVPVEKRPHIIAMTANAMQGDREICLEAGMDDYLSKPIRVEELVHALNQTQSLPSP